MWRATSRYPMMRYSSFRTVFLGVLACCGVNACGGGGGGGGSSGGPTPTPPPPPPPPPTLGITDENAVEVGSRTLFAIGWPEFTNALLLDGVVALTENQLADAVVNCPTAGTFALSLDDADSSVSISAGDVVKMTFSGCNSRSGEISLTIDAAVFNASGIQQLDGSVRVDLSRTTESTTATTTIAHTMRFSDTGTLSIRTIGADITDTVDDSTTGEGPQTDRTMGLSLTRTINAGQEYEISVEGRMESEALGGRIHFATRESFVGALGNHPDGGVIRLTGVDSWAEFAANSDPYRSRRVVNFRVDADGDGAPGDTSIISWRRFAEGILFGVVEPFDPTADRPYNQAPYIRALSMAPESPRTTDAITASVEVIDPEGAALDLSYAWFRNGEPLPGQTGRTLSSSEHLRDDVISVEVTADDGRLTASLRRDVTVVDSPTVFSMLSPPPDAIAHGETASFRIGFSDPDHDPLPESTFRVDHGPAGMEVDADGRVTWTPVGPRFDRTMDFHWSLSAPEFNAPPYSGVIQVTYPEANYPLMRSGLQIYLDYAAFEVADLDSDGASELLIANRQGAVYELEWTGETYEQTWAYPLTLDSEFSESTHIVIDRFPTALSSGDVDGDGLHEIFLSSNGRVVKLDGRERRVSAVADIGPDTRCRLLEFTDVDGDGEREVLCVADAPVDSTHRALVLDPVDLGIEAQAPLGDMGRLATGNVDGDGALEIIGSRGLVYDAVTFALEWMHPTDFTRVDYLPLSLAVGDVDGNGIGEILAVDDAFLRIFSAETRTQMLEMPLLSGPYALHVADIDDDGVDEFSHVLDGATTFYRYNSSSSPDALFLIEAQSFGDEFLLDYFPQLIGSGDMDGDGEMEFVWEQDYTLAITATPPAFEVEWAGHRANDFAGPFSGGEALSLGPGDRGVVFSAFGERRLHITGRPAGPRLIVVDPVTGRMRVSPREIGDFSASRSGRPAFIPVAVSDFDLDGIDDAIMATDYGGERFYTVQQIAADRESWRSPPIPGYTYSIDNADLTGDGQDDIVAIAQIDGSPSRVQVYDIARATLTWESLGFESSFTLADLDSDGTAEVIAAVKRWEDRATGVAVYEPSGEGELVQIAYAELPVEYIWDVVAGDTDGDGQLEVFVLDGNSNQHVHRLDSDLQLLSQFSTSYDTTGIYLEPPATGRRNLILVRGWRGNLAGGPSLHGVDPVTGVEVWRSPRLVGTVSPDGLHYVDADGDGELEMVLATDAGIMITR